MASPASQQRLMLSYLFWLMGFFGVAGLHRLYNRKIASGIIWLLTLGLFGVGQILDIFFVPGMAEEHQLKQLKSKYGEGIYDLLNEPAAIAQTLKQPTQEEKMVKLLRAAQNHAGQISVTQAVMDTGLGFEEVESLLKGMVKSGYASVDNHPSTGVVVYQFDELASS